MIDEVAVVSLATRRAIDRGPSMEAVYDTLQNISPEGVVVRALRWGRDPLKHRERLLTVAELPAREVLSSGDPLDQLLTNGAKI